MLRLFRPRPNIVTGWFDLCKLNWEFEFSGLAPHQDSACPVDFEEALREVQELVDLGLLYHYKYAGDTKYGYGITKAGSMVNV